MALTRHLASISSEMHGLFNILVTCGPRAVLGSTRRVSTIPHRSDRAIPALANRSLNAIPLRHRSVKAMDAQDFDFQDSKPLRSIPGPKGIYSVPGLGTALLFKPFSNHDLDSMHELYKDLLDKYGSLVLCNIGEHSVLVGDPHDIEVIMKNEGKYPVRSSVLIHAMYCEERGIMKGLAHSQGEQWHKFRSPVNPRMMRVKSAHYYLPVQNEVADHLVSRLREEEIKPDDLLDLFFRYACESISVVAFNRRLGYLDKDIAPQRLKVLEDIQGLFEYLHKSLYIPPIIQKYVPTAVKKNYFESLDGVLSAVMELYKEALEDIERQQAEGTLNPDEHNFMLSLMATDKLSTEQMASIALDLFGAGTDSTARNLYMLLHNLARNPDKQQKLHEEIVEVVGPSGSLTSEALGNMPYLLACLRESFRVNFPTQAGTTRRLPTDIVLQGYRIPAGTQMIMMNHWTVQNPKYFPDPDSFTPERWLRDAEGKRTNPIPSSALLPFGFGPRQCVGKRFAEQEIYLAVTKIVQNFVVDLEPGHEDPEIMYRIFVGTKNPIRFRFHNRN